MSFSLSEFMNVYTFPPGRREFVLRSMAEVARRLGLKDLAKGMQQAVEHENKLRDMERALAADRARSTPPRLRELDPELDLTIGAMYRQLSEAVAVLKGTPRAEAAERILGDLLPEGAAAVVHLAYPEQAAECESVRSKLQREYADDVRVAGIQPYVDRMAVLTPEYVSLVKEYKTGREITLDEVRAAREQGQENLLVALVKVLGRYADPTPENIQARSELLAPFRFHTEAIRRYYQSRRSVRDVDPNTGDEVPEALDQPLVEVQAVPAPE